MALGNLGYIAHHSGQYGHAFGYYQRSLALLREAGDVYNEALALDWIGQTHTTIGQHDQARVEWREAVRLYRQQGRDEDAERIQGQLDALDHSDIPEQGGHQPRASPP
ncbi:tetratricopeptide repeat protein [Saccharothrix stipae]